MTANTKHKILIVDDEEVARSGLARILEKLDVTVDHAGDGEEGLQKAIAGDFDLILTDFKMPKLDGLGMLDALIREKPLSKVIMITGRGTIDTAVDALKVGAYDFIQKPFDITMIRSVVERAFREKDLAEENLYLKKQLSQHIEHEEGIVWEDKKMKDLLLLVNKIAPTSNPILVEGESGVGKEILAKTLHNSSRLKDKKYIAVNCGAFSEDILVSELFGYEKGAFTGADQRKAGIFEDVDGGTLFLDEIGDLPMAMQARFLRVLQEKEFYRLGGRDLVKTEFRLVSATNKDLKQLVASGKFREDLYYRIRVHYIKVPPLRERYPDVAALTNFFIRKHQVMESFNVTGISREALAYLQSYDWPGNVRELENVVKEMMVTSEGEVLSEDDVPTFIKNHLKGTEDMETLEEVKLGYVRRVLKHVGGNRTRAAKVLGIPRITLQRLLSKNEDLAQIK